MPRSAHLSLFFWRIDRHLGGCGQSFLLPVLGDENPFNIILSDEDLKVEEKLFTHFGGRAASLGGKPARMGRWVMSLLREKDKEVRWAGFLAF